MRCLLAVILLVSVVATEILSDDNSISKTQSDELQAANQPQHEETHEKQARTERGAELASLVAKKIKRLTKEIFKNAKTNYDKNTLMEQLETIITEMGRRDHFTTEEIKICTKLILEGIEFALKHRGNERTIERRSNDNNHFSPKYTMASVSLGTTTTTFAATKTIRETTLKIIATERLETKQTPNKTVPIQSKQKSTKSPNTCEVDAICANIRNLRKLQCSDGSSVDINHLCDGKEHCADGSDERQCKQIASSKIQKVKSIFNTLRNSIHRNCFKPRKESLLEILRSLEARLKNFRRGGSVVIVNQVAAVYQIAFALGESFCTEPKSIETNYLIRRNKGNKETEGPWSAGSCSCKKGSCREAFCDHSCRTSCVNRYQLTRWNCPAVDGNKTVSFDNVCDSLPDCSDGTDEINCSNGKPFNKFKVRKIQNELIGKIKSKINKELYLPVTSKLQNLIRLIKELQPTSSSDNSKVKVVSRRDKAINGLVSIYIDMGEKMTSEKIEKEVYRFLESISEGVVEITKLQWVLEQRAVVCPCKEAECALKNCSQTCVRMCAAKARLKFHCAGVQLPTSAICNGTTECPDGSDEQNCKIGFCQKYHLMELIRNVDKVVKKHKGTSIGEKLDSWMTKFKKNILSQLNSGMKKRRLLLMLVTEGLEDLVSTYAATDGRRSSDGPLLEAMEAASKELKDTLMLCTE